MANPFHSVDLEDNGAKLADASTSLTRQSGKILSTAPKRAQGGAERGRAQQVTDIQSVSTIAGLAEENRFSALEQSINQNPKRLASAENKLFDIIDSVDKNAVAAINQERSEFAKIDPGQYLHAKNAESQSVKDLWSATSTHLKSVDQDKVEQFAIHYFANPDGARAELLAADPSGQFLQAMENYRKAESNPVLRQVKGIELKTNASLDDTITLHNRLAKMYVNRSAKGDIGTALQAIWNAKEWEHLKNSDRFFLQD